MKHGPEFELSGHGSFGSYLFGFILSILLTLAAYFLVVEKLLTGMPLTSAIISLCILQVGVQLYYFLHLGEDTKPYWNIFAFLFMVLVVVIVIGGSLWIMANLDSRVMPQM